MDDTPAQPGALPLPGGLIDALLRCVGVEPGEGAPVEVTFRDAHSNDFAELRLADGRTLVAKRGRYPWSAERFRTSRVASALLHERAGIVVPRPLDLSSAAAWYEERPVEAYWRIDLPTLQEAWPSLEPEERRGALRSWGRLLARVHAVRLPGPGALLRAGEGTGSFLDFLETDLRERLLPAVAGEWPAALPLLEQLLRERPVVAGEGAPRLLHGDLHMGNVLCRRGGDGVACVGLLDLETAAAGFPEFDLANLAVHHGPLFGQPLEGAWLEEVVAGYGAPLDAGLVAFCRGYHLLNLGFHSALVGHHWHARQVVREVRRVLCCPGPGVAAPRPAPAPV